MNVYTPCLIRVNKHECYPLCLLYAKIGNNSEDVCQTVISPLGFIVNYCEYYAFPIACGCTKSDVDCHLNVLGIFYKNYWCFPPLFCAKQKIIKHNVYKKSVCTPLGYAQWLSSTRENVDVNDELYMISIIGCIDHRVLEGDVDAPERQFMEDKCVICHSTELEGGISPCGHTCLCGKCAEIHKDKLNGCPICRGQIDGFYKEVAQTPLISKVPAV